MNTYSTMHTSAFSQFVPSIDTSAAGGEFLHCLGSVGIGSEGPVCSLSSGYEEFLGATSTVTD